MLLGNKIAAAILLTLLRLLAGLLPLKIYKKLDDWSRRGSKSDEEIKSRKHRFDIFLSTSLCFGAGLLLSTCFIHMIPDVRESLDKASKSGNWPILEQYPFAEGMVCLGFFFIYFLEELGHKCAHQLDNTERSDAEPGEENERGRATQSTSINDTGQHMNIAVEMEEVSAPPSSTSETSIENQSITATNFEQHKINSVRAAFRGLLLVVALSFHSIFEGMAIGLQAHVKDVWFLFIAVMLHELVIMFCIGLEMLVAKLRTAVYVTYMIILGLITPIGVAIGILITEYVKNPSPGHILIIGILQGIASGTLLYVTLLEILERERAKKNINGLIKLATFFLGFVLLLLVDGLENGSSQADIRRHNDLGGLGQFQNGPVRTLWDTSTFPSRPITQNGF